MTVYDPVQATPQYDRDAFARQLCDEHWPEWMDEPDPDQIARSRYAVLTQRDSDSWVTGAMNVHDLADIALSLNTDDGIEYEWIEGVWDMRTGEQIAVDFRRSFTVTVIDTGERATASYSPREDA